MYILNGLNVSPYTEREMPRIYTLEKNGWAAGCVHHIPPDINKLFFTQRILFLYPLTICSQTLKFSPIFWVWSDALFYLAFFWLLLKMTVYSYIIGHLHLCVWIYIFTYIYLPNFHWVVWLLFEKLIRKNFYVFLTLIFCFYVLANIFSQSITYLCIYCFFVIWNFYFNVVT